MNEYFHSFNEIFKFIIEHYGFEAKPVDDSKIFLIKENYQIEFIMWREAVEVSFCQACSDTEMLKYDVRDFIITHMTDEDRVISDSISSVNGTSVYRRNVKSLHYFSNALKNHFSSMLEGNMDWFQAYEKSDWYRQPRIEKMTRAIQ
ncbi:hypothetical protein C7434_1180 [Pantoea sp. PNA 14-12]|nr:MULTISPECIES: hypothetical protein [Pantoea]TDS72368.1 hypothetical protein C7434_1180 [Pantoea sp. PNA 14-12]